MQTIGSFSLRETLELLFPGVFLFIVFYLFWMDLTPLHVLKNQSNQFGIVLSGLFISILLGSIIYSLDFSKRISFFKKHLPTYRINAEFGKKNANDFFKFYDLNVISDKQKNNTEKLSSIFHFSVNMFVASLIAFIIEFIIYCVLENYTLNEELLVLILIMAILSFINSLMVFFCNNKLKWYYDRQFICYKKHIED